MMNDKPSHSSRPEQSMNTDTWGTTASKDQPPVLKKDSRFYAGITAPPAIKERKANRRKHRRDKAKTMAAILGYATAFRSRASFRALRLVRRRRACSGLEGDQIGACC